MDDMEFQGVFESIWKFQGSRAEFSLNQKKIVKFPWFSVFGLGIPGVKLRFLQNFQWESDKPKNYMDFFRKKYVSTTELDFFWNSTILKYKRVGDESRWDINLK